MKKQHKGHATSAGDSSQDFEVGYPAETTEAFCDGHVRAFAFFGGVPQSILYDNTRIAVARILGDGKRQRTRVFAELQSHYLFEDRFGRPDKGNDKGKVEGLVGYARRNFLVPIPVFESFEALNAYLLECCRRRQAERLRGREGTIGERLERDLAAFQTPLPPPYDACEKVATTVSSLSLVRYRLDDVAAGVRQPLDIYAASHPGVRVMPDRFMEIRQAMGTQKGREAGSAYIKAFIEEMKASGFVADALKRSNQPEATVAPPA